MNTVDTSQVDERPDAPLLEGGALSSERPVTPASPADGAGPAAEKDEVEGQRLVPVGLTSMAAFLATAAAGWMCAGVFQGVLPRLVAVLAAGAGVGLVALSYRMARPLVLQSLAIPVAVALGAGLALADRAAGGGNLTGLVQESLRGGGIAQPPVAFDPGWRFLLVVFVMLVGSTAAALAVGLNRAKLAVALPVPLVLGAGLVQPTESTVLSSIVAVVLLIGALAVSYGGELAGAGATSGQFELRRFARGAVILVVLAAALFGLSKAGFLFPPPSEDVVIPPKRPEASAPRPDRVLFAVESDRQLTWRLGVLDGYDGEAWLTPPFDTSRLLPVPEGGAIPEPVPTVSPAQTLDVTFTVSDIEFDVVPAVANARTVTGDLAIQFDPRTQTFRLPDGRPDEGARYTVTAGVPPTGTELASAPPPGPGVEEFLELPSPPTAVAALLADAPVNAWERLQFVRTAFYSNVVAAGEGNPVPVPPERVTEMLEGQEATPYEIAAGEALLARWAGVPARLGYGYFGGDEVGSGQREIRPKHGATWLEVYFEGHGWVPIVGTPPRARAALNDNQKNEDPRVQPTDELALVIYAPVRTSTIQLLYVAVRYWLARVLPVLALAVLVVAFYPGLLKRLRRMRRRRWAAQWGPREQVAAAYAEFRDVANDLNVGDPSTTPLEFLRDLASDPEHRELAWLVTRVLWGDLCRDPRPDDAEAAREMAVSLTRRVRRTQPFISRLIAVGSRVSLRNPYLAEMPNLWPRWAVKGLGLRVLRTSLGSPFRSVRRVRRLVPAGAR